MDSTNDNDQERERLRQELEEAMSSGSGSKAARFALNTVGGAIPFAGGILSAIAGAWSEGGQDRANKLFFEWMKLQEAGIKEIAITIMEIVIRLDLNDESVRQRVESPEYQSLIRKAFRDWSAAESEEKRSLIRKLLCNAAATQLCTDDVVKLFIEWIRKFSELHFRVIREIHASPGSTREDVWRTIHRLPVREDSAEADLFKLLIHDLSVGHVIRQHRQTDGLGRFPTSKSRSQSAKGTTRYLTSAFDDGKEYELTALGRQFVHYTMNEIVPKIGHS